MTIAAVSAQRALALDEHRAHARQPRHRGRRAIDLRRPDRARTSCAVDGDAPSLISTRARRRERRDARLHRRAARRRASAFQPTARYIAPLSTWR